MSKIKLTGSNSGYVEIASAADAGNLTLTLPTGGTALLGNAGNVFSGITTTGQLDINGSIDVSSTSVFNDDLTLTGASYNVLWDKSDNQLEFGDNAKLSFGGDSDMQLYHLGGANSYIVNKANNLYVQSNNVVEIGSVDTNGSNVETSARFVRNGASELFWNDVKKFETISIGASVYGQLNIASLNGGPSSLSTHFGSVRYGNENASFGYSTRRSLDLINTHEADVALRLMFEIAISDGNLDKSELQLIKKRADKLATKDLKASTIVKKIIDETEESASIYPLIKKINGSYTNEEKIELLKVLWELVRADSIVDAYEENLYFKIADLIMIKRSLANKIKQQNS